MTKRAAALNSPVNSRPRAERRRDFATLLLLLVVGCSAARPELDDANEVRLDAVVEASSGWATAAVCLAVDPRSGPAVNAHGSTALIKPRTQVASSCLLLLAWGMSIRSRCVPGATRRTTDRLSIRVKPHAEV
jgi:hypothetical protein